MRPWSVWNRADYRRAVAQSPKLYLDTELELFQPQIKATKTEWVVWKKILTVLLGPILKYQEIIIDFASKKTIVQSNYRMFRTFREEKESEKKNHKKKIML